MSIKLEAGSITTIMDTQLNSLASNASGVDGALGAEYDNSSASNLYIWGLFELNVTFGTAPTDRTTVDLYLIPAPDGTNYDDSDATANASRAPASCLVGSWEIKNTTSAQKIPLFNIPLPPTKFKPFVLNQTNQAFPASGSTIKLVPYRLQ